ncbi:MAG: glycosyltransferase family 4 protein [Pseudomonadota bacterium]
MSRPAAAFAIPGDLDTLTGGYIYERRLLDGLRALGHEVAHLELAASFPDPSPAEMAHGIAAMAGIAPDRPLIVDGLVFGAAEGLERVRAPVLAMIHHPLAYEEGLTETRRAHLYRTERDNVARAAHILVPSAHTRGVLIADYAADPGRITIAPPGVDRPNLPRQPRQPPLILSVGLLHPRKGHDVLLRALATLQDLDWQALIVGRAHDPAHAADLHALCTSLDLDNRVRFPGEVPRAELTELFASAEIFALATRYEGYGMVFAEALTHGLPIVATDGGAVPDTIPKGAGLICPVGDAAAFADALRTLLTDRTVAARIAATSARAGAALPGWGETARIASGVITALAERAGSQTPR